MWLLFGFAGLLVIMMATLKYNENIYDFIPVSGNEQKAITLYQDISGGQRLFAMLKMKDEKADAIDSLTEAVDCFTHKIQPFVNEGYIAEVTSQVDFEKVTGITDFVYQNIPLMMCDSDYIRMENLLSSPDKYDEQLANDVQIMMMPTTSFFSSNINNDPLGLFTPVLERLQAHQTAMPIDIDNGYIFSAGKEYAIVMMTSPYGAMESANNGKLVGKIDSVAKQIMQEKPNIEVATTGAPVIAVGNANQIKYDSQWAISISVTLILLLLLYSFRRVKNLLLIGFAIFFGWLFAMGFMAVIRNDVSLIVLGIGSIIIGIAVNYPLHFIAHTDHGGTTREVLKEMISPLLIGNITTVGAFASLIPLEAPALRDLGLFAAFMLIGTILFVLVFLPHLVRKRLTSSEEHLSFGKISSISPERHRWLLWIILILTIFFGWHSLDISFDTNMHHINYMTDSQKQLLSSMHASAGINDTVNVYLVTEGDSWDSALEKRLQVSHLLDSLQSVELLNSYSDVTTLICSKDEQQRRIDKWNLFWNQHHKETITLLQQKAPKYGFSANAFEGFTSIIGKTYSPKPFEYFEPIRSVLLNNSFSTSTGVCSVVDVIDARDKNISLIESTLNNSLGTKGYAFDFMRMNSAVANSLSNDFNYIGLACGLIVFIFLWISFGRLELSILAFIPMALGWIWILGIMSILGMQFNIVNVILATFIFGQGDDYTIFITDGLINEFAYRKKLLPSFKNSIIISALIMFIGMGSLIVARHPALHSLAEVTIVGMFTVVLMAWVVPPLIFEWIIKNNGVPRRTPVTIDQIIRTAYCSVAYLSELTYGSFIGAIIKILPDKKRTLEAWYHRVIQKSMYVNVNHIWGVDYEVQNEYDENFSRGSIIICNHQSILDPIYLLSLSPNILVLVGNKVWRNPCVHIMFKLSRFMRTGKPVDNLKGKITKAVEDGYNVIIFPEGLRSDEKVRRFHKGAFHIALDVGIDVLPIYIHGSGHVMPKSSAFASRGKITIEIGKRIPAKHLHNYGSDDKMIRKTIHSLYKEKYEQMRKKIENTHYFHYYIISKYLYKGISVEKETRRILKKYNDFSTWIDDFTLSDKECNKVKIINAGRGQFSLLFALVHPELDVFSYTNDPDDAALALSCEPIPANLHIFCSRNEDFSKENNKNVINLCDIIRR